MRLVKQRIIGFFLLLLFILSLSTIVTAIGISPADVYVNFVPNHEYVIDYSIDSYRPFEFYTEGDFSEYTRVETLHHTDRQGNFRVHLVLPEDYDPPGKHKLFVAAREKPSSGGVNTIAAIRGFIEIDVPFPGYYAVLEVNVNDVNEDDPIPVSVNVYNKGRLNISSARVSLSIFNSVKTLWTVESETFGIETSGGYTFQKTLPAGTLPPGSYRLKAELSYEGSPKEKVVDFRVGTFDVNIVNYTRQMYNNSVNLFEIEIESLWNDRIDTVYMDLNIKNGSAVLSSVKTPPFDMIPWEKKKSSLYWNTAGIPVGEYDLEIVLHYAGNTRTENRKIYIVDRPIIEETRHIPVSTIILVVIALLLIGFNVFFILRRRREEDNKEEKDKPEKKKGK